MKTAVIMSGHFRTFEEAYPSIYHNILKPLNPDIYVHSYQDPHQEKYLKLLNPKKYILEDDSKIEHGLSDFYLSKNMGYVNVKGVYLQCRKIKLCCDLIEDDYDLMVRLRFDCKYTEPLTQEFIEKKINLHVINIPAGGNWEGGTCDLFAVGNQQNITHYCNLYDNMKKYVDGGLPFHTEILLKKHLENQIVYRFEYPVLLRKKYDQPYLEDKIMNPLTA